MCLAFRTYTELTGSSTPLGLSWTEVELSDICSELNNKKSSFTWATVHYKRTEESLVPKVTKHKYVIIWSSGKLLTLLLLVQRRSVSNWRWRAFYKYVRQVEPSKQKFHRHNNYVTRHMLHHFYMTKLKIIMKKIN